MHLTVVLDVPAHPASIRLARHVAGVALLRAGVSTDCVNGLGVAASEAHIEVCRHSERGQGFEVIMRLAEDAVSIDVLAATAGIAGRGPPGGARRLSNLGGALMAAFTDRVAFGHDDGDIGSVHLLLRVDWADVAPFREASGPAERLERLLA